MILLGGLIVWSTLAIVKVIGRPKAPLVLTADEREELVRLTQRARVNRHVAF